MKECQNKSRYGRRYFAIGCSLGAFFLILLHAQAIILLRTGDPEANTTEPAGELDGSGWQFLGDWGIFFGTVIGPKHFVTARHVGGAVGGIFKYHGESYQTTSFYEFGKVDLRVWEICGTFPEPFAPLYLSDDEEGKPLVVFGRGSTRGEGVHIQTRLGVELRGWRTGKSDHRWRWGENIVTKVYDYAELGERFQPRELQYLVVDFDREGVFNEAHLSPGDSGGPVFIEKDGEWALAGINYATDGFFNFIPEGKGFVPLLFDAGGFYIDWGQDIGWVYIRDRKEDIASSFYSTRVSNYVSLIEAVLDGSMEPKGREPWVVSASRPKGIYLSEYKQELDERNQEIRLPVSGQARFYRLLGCSDYEMTSIRVEGSSVLLHYRMR
jgi:hypothetical protein